MPIDENGKVFIEIDKPTIHYNTSEQIKDEKGNVLGSRVVEKEIVQPSEKIYDLESRGLFKRLTWRILSEKEVWKMIEGSTEFEKKKSFVVIYYAFDASQMPCTCNGSSEYVYLRKMPSGVFKRCFACNRTSGSMAYGDKDKFKHASVKKLHEKIVTAQQAKAMWNKGEIDFCDAFIAEKLGLPRYGCVNP